MSLVVPFDQIFGAETGLLARHKSWARVELGNVCRVINGFPFESNLFTTVGGFPIVRMRDLSKGSTGTFYTGNVPPEVVIDNGDLLIGMDGNFRGWEWRGGKAGLNQRVCKITSDERFLLQKFLFYGINAYLKAIEDATSSVTVGHLSSRDILRIAFPLPPLAEQRRIVEKLEKLLSKVDDCKSRISTISVFLKRFRQSVLAAACSGRLTADWRYEHGIEREWEHTTIDSICEIIGGSQPPKKNFVYEPREGYIRFIQIRDYKSDDHLTFIPKQLARRFCSKEDVMIGRYGPPLFQILRGIEGAYNVALMKAVPKSPKRLLNDFLFILLQNPPLRNYIINASERTVGQDGVRKDLLETYEIDLPSIDEQREIIRRVNSLVALADKIGIRHKEGQRCVDHLSQSILAKAFRGELVPTEAELAEIEGRSFESAKELLERLSSSKRNGTEDKRASQSRRAKKAVA